jgi:O-antigen/teichoic acid export membrane protein
MTRLRRFLVGAGYSVFGAALQRLLVSGAGIVVARRLGVTDYGIYVNLVAVVNLVMMFGLCGVNTAFSVFIPAEMLVSRARAREVTIAGVLVTTGVLVVAVMVAWALADPAAQVLYHGVVSGHDLRLALPYAAALTLDTLLMAALFGYQEFKLYSLAMLLLGVLAAGGAIGGVSVARLPGLLVGLAIAYSLHAAFLCLILLKIASGPRPSWSGLRERLLQIVAFALPAFLAGSFNAPAIWLGNLAIARAGGAVACGLFGVASSLSQLALFIPLTLAGPLVPMFSEFAAKEDAARLSQFAARNTRMVWCLNLPVAILLTALAPHLIAALYGPAFEGAAPAFAILASANLLISVQSVMAYVLIAKRRMWESFAVNAVWFVAVLALIAPLATGHQTGFAVALLAAYIVSTLPLLVLLRRHVDLGVLADRCGRLALLTLAGLGIGAGVGFSPWPAVAAVAVGLAAASVAAVLEWRFVLDSGERKAVLSSILAWRGPAPAAATQGDRA